MDNIRVHVLTEPEASQLAEWIVADLFGGSRLPKELAAPTVVHIPKGTPFRDSLAEIVARGDDEVPHPTLFVLVLWRGTEPDTQAQLQGVRDYVATCQGSGMRVALQAINAKEGQHTFYREKPDSARLDDVRANVTTAIQNKLKTLLPLEKRATVTEANAAAGVTVTKIEPSAITAERHEGAAPDVPSGPLVDGDDLAARVKLGQGEYLAAVAGATAEEYAAVMSTLAEYASAQGLVCTSVFQRDDGLASEVLCRNAMTAVEGGAHHCIDMRIAVCGNVDSGKSTLTSVLTRQQYDDGRGAARAKVFKHKHEADTGRTSCISEQYLGYNDKCGVVNYYTTAATKEELKAQSRKIITFFDLAGHEKYLKTTVLGMTRAIPDYAIIVVSANNGIQRMTKEHLALCLALKIPFVVVVTRVDSTPDNVRQDTVNSIVKMLKLSSVRKLPLMVRRPEDVIIAARNIRGDKIAPVVEVSNVTGHNIDLLHSLFNLLPSRFDWASAKTQPSQEMVVDSTFYVTGVGTVVGGIVRRGHFRAGDNVLIGPDSNGHFRATQVKSLHSKGIDVHEVQAGCDATLALKKEKKSNIRKGMVVVGGDLAATARSYWEFECDILILYHSTTISSHYEPVIHSSTVRQSARIHLSEGMVLRTGDKARVRFRFLYRPEYMTVGQKLVFREGRTKGLGTVTGLADPVAQMATGTEDRRRQK
eukprot:PhM_4_TR15249/c0_g1_i1/m.59364